MQRSVTLRPRKALEIKLYRASDSGLLCINLTEGLLQGRQPRLVRGFAIPPPPEAARTEASRAERCANSTASKRKATSLHMHDMDEPRTESPEQGLTAAMAVSSTQYWRLNQPTADSTEGGGQTQMIADVFTVGYAFEKTINTVRDKWDPQAFADNFSDLRTAEMTFEAGGAFVGILFDLTYLPTAGSLDPELAEKKWRDMSLRDHIGARPSIMRGLQQIPASYSIAGTSARRSRPR